MELRQAFQYSNGAGPTDHPHAKEKNMNLDTDLTPSQN